MIAMDAAAILDSLAVLATVVAIDITLAGDNAVVIGMAAAGLPQPQRRHAIAVGIVAAALLRVLFALVTVRLMGIVGLTLAGGLLLLWVGWKLWREIRHPAGTTAADPTAGKSFRQAAAQIVVADLSMSLDNVLAVAGAAREHVAIMVVGLGLSVALTGLAATLVARLLQRHRWLAYVGLALVLWVAMAMIRTGSHEIMISRP